MLKELFMRGLDRARQSIGYGPHLQLRDAGDAGGVVVNPVATQQFITPPTLLASLGTGITQPYAQNIWVYSCVNAIADNIASIPLNFFTGSPDDKKPFMDDSLVQLNNSPNPYMSGSELIQAIFVWLGLSGEAFCILERKNAREYPKEIWCFDPGRFKEVKDNQTGLIRGWKYRKGTKEIPLETYEVMFLRYFNPYDDIRGLSPLAAGQKSVDQDSYAAEYNMRFFQNSARPDGVLETKDNLDEENYYRIRDQWNSRHQGLSKARSIAVLEGGLSYKQIALSHKDTDYLEGRKYNRDEILAVYKVPPEEIGLQAHGSSSLNSDRNDTQRKLFWETCLFPKMTLFEYGLWSQVFAQLPGPKIWGEFDRKSIPAMQEDEDRKVGRAQKYWQMGVPFNVLNQMMELGFPDIPGGDIGYVPFNLVPITQAGQETPAGNPQEGKALIPVVFPPSLQLTGPEILVRRRLDRRTWWQQYHQLQSAFEKKFQPRMKRYFYEQRKEQLRLIEQHWEKSIRLVRSSYSEAEDLLFDQEVWNEKLQKISWAFWENVGDEAGKNLMVGLGADPDNFVLADSPAISVLKKKLIKVVDINEVTRESLRDTLAEGMAGLETVAELQKRVREVFNFSEARSLTIARTETGQAAAAARDAAMEVAGVERHEWTTAGDDAVREIHAEMDGETVDRGEPFSNGLLYPCDPAGEPEEIINCRCAASPVVEKD
jgi:HK97 family phage portal protein